MKHQNNRNIIFFICFVAIVILSYFYFFRLDLTSDKRYSLSEQTKQLMSRVDAPLEVVVYLDGDLNPGFLRLKKSTADLLDELSVYSKKSIE
ncbi:MAG: DUF7088 domain-containing protein, partial [Paludibacter sp.]